VVQRIFFIVLADNVVQAILMKPMLL
jgi:hypothetical protein